jgi:hypothetical protein
MDVTDGAMRGSRGMNDVSNNTTSESRCVNAAAWLKPWLLNPDTNAKEITSDGFQNRPLRPRKITSLHVGCWTALNRFLSRRDFGRRRVESWIYSTVLLKSVEGLHVQNAMGRVYTTLGVKFKPSKVT